MTLLHFPYLFTVPVCWTVVGKQYHTHECVMAMYQQGCDYPWCWCTAITHSCKCDIASTVRAVRCDAMHADSMAVSSCFINMINSVELWVNKKTSQIEIQLKFCYRAPVKLNLVRMWFFLYNFSTANLFNLYLGYNNQCPFALWTKIKETVKSHDLYSHSK